MEARRKREVLKHEEIAITSFLDSKLNTLYYMHALRESEKVELAGNEEDGCGSSVVTVQCGT